MWLYASGFPKAQDVGKALNKRGVENKLEGWKTALKPAHEPIVMARKPFKGSGVDNVLKWGTGGINIDESRIGLNEELDKSQLRNINRSQKTEKDGWGMNSNCSDVAQVVRPEGRFPANIIFDEEAGKILDEQSGVVRMASNVNGIEHHFKLDLFYSFRPGEPHKTKNKQVNVPEIKGGASRFFYCPKTSKKDRNEGLEHLEDKLQANAKFRPNHLEKALDGDSGKPHGRYTPTKNHHPTVKPTALMLYLIRLVTPKGGTTLDPFMGSGSTGKAAVRGGFDFIGIEREEEYFQIANARIQYELDLTGYEIDKEYYDNANERIERHKRQLNLF